MKLTLVKNFALIGAAGYNLNNKVFMPCDKGQKMETTAKIFQNGRSQAVRIPKEFRLKGSEVRIIKRGDKLILVPLETSKWPKGFWDVFSVDPDFKTPDPLLSKPFNLD